MVVEDDNSLRAWHFRQFKRSLQALATASSGQLMLFPHLVVRADELAFDFDHWALVVRSTYEGELSRSQADSLAAIGEKLATMSRDGTEFDPELWTEAALGSSMHWDHVRRLAAEALEAFGWSMESAPHDRQTGV